MLHTACAAGTHQPEAAAVSCATCPVHNFCPVGTAQPLPCPDGTFGPRTGLPSAGECAACTGGYWCHAGQRFPCAVGSYTLQDSAPANRTTLRACMACPEHATTLGEGTSSLQGCVCDVNFMEDPNSHMVRLTTAEPNVRASVRCVPCPVGAQCSELGTTLATLALKPNQWRLGNRTADVRPCSINWAPSLPTPCAGGIGTGSDGYCHSGLEGPRCASCRFEGTYYDARTARCAACPATGAGALAVQLLVLSAIATTFVVTFLAGRALLAVHACD